MVFLALFALSMPATGCAAEREPAASIAAEGDWVAERQTSGQLTTIRTKSGSVWGGKARLVEELSIGVDLGADEYMFGSVSSLYADEDEIYVADSQVPALRVFDHEGLHLRDIGGEGRGPGEFTWPVFVAGTDDGRVLVLDGRKPQSVIVYDSSGTPLEPLRVDGGYGFAQCCLHPMAALVDGSVLLEVRATDPSGLDRTIATYAVQRIHADGTAEPAVPVPRLGFEPRTFRYGSRNFERLVPLSPSLVWAISPSGAVIAGVSDAYRFEVHYLDGRRVAISRDIEPLTVLDIEAEYHRRFVEGVYGWTPEGAKAPLSWDGDIPATKPLFERFIPTASGEVWVRRRGAAEAIEGCNLSPIRHSGINRAPPPCHESPDIVDVFELSGRYLGEIELPEGISLAVPQPFVRDDSVVALVAENDVSKVKRFRIVPPEGVSMDTSKQ